MNKTNISILDNINGEIRRRGMTKEEFCQQIGIDRRTYSSWQSKGELPSTVLLKCAKLLNCSLDYLARDVTIEESA